MEFSNGRTGEKCQESGIYNPEHKHNQEVNLRLFQDETFPTYDGDAKTIWVKTSDLFSEKKIKDVQDVLRESVRRYKHQSGWSNI